MILNLPDPCRKLLTVFGLLLLFASTAFSQTNSIVTGKVTESGTNDPLVGVTVKSKLSNAATTTNAQGAFSISVPANDVLTFSYIGYTPLTQSVNGQTTMNISMTVEAKGMNEVVVIGYGSRKRADITSAISTISSKDIERSTALTPELALQGQAAGVQVTSGGGDPTARPVVRIRGVSSFNYADPLYVIDGVPLAEGSALRARS